MLVDPMIHRGEPKMVRYDGSVVPGMMVTAYATTSYLVLGRDYLSALPSLDVAFLMTNRLIERVTAYMTPSGP